MDYEKLCGALHSKGKAWSDRSRHHVFFFMEIDGKTYRATKVSHSAQGQIDRYILREIAHQMRLTTKELKQFVACPLGREQWIELWSQRGYTWRRRD